MISITEATSSTQTESDEAAPTGEERSALREQLLGVDAQNMLRFENRAVRKFGPAAGIFIRQIVFWDGERSAAEEGWMWKSRREMERETGLTQRYQEEARKTLKAAGVLEEEIRPVGYIRRKTLHYRPDLHGLLDLLYPVQEAVSGTGHEADGTSAAYLSEETPVGAVSSTGYEADDDLSAYLSDYPPAEPESGKQESTSGEDFQEEAPLYPPEENGPDDFFLEDPEDILYDLDAGERDAAATTSSPSVPTPQRNPGSDGAVEGRSRVYVAPSMGEALLQAIDGAEDDERRGFEKLLLQWQRALDKESAQGPPEAPVMDTDGGSLPPADRQTVQAAVLEAVEGIEEF